MSTSTPSNIIKFNKLVPTSKKVASVLLKNAKVLKLTFDQRQELPREIEAQDGTLVHCEIDEPVEQGDKLISTSNEWAVIESAPEPLFEIDRDQDQFEAFLHIAGLKMWPIELLSHAARVVASHECQHMLEHLHLRFTPIQTPLVELNIPVVKKHDCCDHPGHAH